MGPEKTDRSGHPGKFVRKCGLAEQCLGNPCAKTVSDRDHFFGCAEGAGAHKDGNLLAGVEDISRGLKVFLVRYDLRRPVSKPGMVRVCANKPSPGRVGSARKQGLAKTQGG